ncbi:SDR family NAD(P)-dependent oxidoreductase [Mycobacterium sp.]|uniref:SDR family NAD(P)-dependent oxidoreductase n=1 Tax=Mycobacterium sp. TaxID=1785 RepID=UPI003C735BA0
MTSTPTLAGKWALVTGCSRGIGAAIVRRLACQGATVAVNYRSDRAAADALVGELTDQGWAASAFPGDVSDAAQTHELVGAVVSEFGGLDLLVSNAGVEHFGRWRPSPRPTSIFSFRPTWPDNCWSPRPSQDSSPSNPVLCSTSKAWVRQSPVSS